MHEKAILEQGLPPVKTPVSSEPLHPAVPISFSMLYQPHSTSVSFPRNTAWKEATRVHLQPLLVPASKYIWVLPTHLFLPHHLPLKRQLYLPLLQRRKYHTAPKATEKRRKKKKNHPWCLQRGTRWDLAPQSFLNVANQELMATNNFSEIGTAPPWWNLTKCGAPSLGTYIKKYKKKSWCRFGHQTNKILFSFSQFS